MRFDLENTFLKMLKAAKGAAKGEWKNARKTVEQFFNINKAHLGLISEKFIAGKMDEEGFEYRLNELKTNVEMQTLALKIITRVAAQNAANAAIEVFEKAVKAAIGI